MPKPGKGGRYHHGDLRAALIDTAVELIGERGLRSFSMAEASRRLGVAVSAPYAHFADRDDLLAAVAVRAFEQFFAALGPAMREFRDPADRLSAMARAYVRFAAYSRPMFEVLYELSLDKTRHPEIEEAERPLNEAFLGCVLALSGGDKIRSDDLATAVGGASAARQLVDEDHVSAVVGPFDSDAAEGSLPLFKQAGVIDVPLTAYEPAHTPSQFPNSFPVQFGDNQSSRRMSRKKEMNRRLRSRRGKTENVDRFSLGRQISCTLTR